ncbi:monovalent cation/H+ antiporter subunit D [Variovorax terrae]|uniref:Monovalent cation/H+ antiporter subunit D n=1 Tax=Variovorax terrae TaxID=2923278 RepID=A0A9X1VTB2_9BURK|nr:monovalent cation/H+ antiporter subunit D [Variovorax terrae]MCJ0762985.1 monovalent cation/H+ antiporter subunit D [Variovorax terrae]
MSWNLPHLIIAPILLPLLTAALMLLLGAQRQRWKALLNVVSCVLGLGIAVALLCQVQRQGAPDTMGIYLPSNWHVPFGIVLAVDRLSALMLVLAACISLAALLFSLARWHRAGVHFHTLFQIQLMGLNGAFLTADLFNLFVFFEVMLSASYGLLLHGSGWARVRSGLHYIAVNLFASSLFLVGVAMLYGVTGTLNMADMARKLPLVPAGDLGLLHAGAAILAVAFLAKAAIWPLNFWLTPAYSAASAPVAALFAIMTKVGIYALLRLWTLFFPAGADAAAPFGTDALVWGGLATLAFGALGVMASQHLGRLASYAIIVSSGTLLAAIGFGQVALTGGALFYLVSSTLAGGALFLLVELIERSRQADAHALEADDDDGEAIPFPVDLPEPPPGTNLDDDEEALIGRAIPAAMAFLGLSFILCTLLLAGLPPLSGFVAKFSMLTALLNPGGLGAEAAPVPTAGWTLLTLMIASGLLSTIALSRVGIRHFWAPQNRPPPRLRVIECLPVAALLLGCALLALYAEPVLRYTRATAAELHQPSLYIDAVMAARPVPNPQGGAR